MEIDVFMATLKHKEDHSTKNVVSAYCNFLFLQLLPYGQITHFILFQKQLHQESNLVIIIADIYKVLYKDIYKNFDEQHNGNK